MRFEPGAAGLEVQMFTSVLYSTQASHLSLIMCSRARFKFDETERNVTSRTCPLQVFPEHFVADFISFLFLLDNEYSSERDGGVRQDDSDGRVRPHGRRRRHDGLQTRRFRVRLLYSYLR